MLGKVVLITGASSGIGAGTAVLFASKGCLLSLTGRSESGLQDTLQACIRAGAQEQDILLISAELQELENLQMIVDKTVSKFGKLDVLVNNAGRSIWGSIENTTYENYDIIMNTNLKSVFFLTQAALPHLIESKGNVVNVSSAVSTICNKRSIVYSMSKAALDHFTRTVALDVADKKVRVNAVNPGAINTPFFTKIGATVNFEDLAAKVHAMKRAGTVEEIAKSIAFLADDEQSSFTTGVTLLADGGTTLMGPL